MPEVTLIPGDGVGPELAAATRLVLDHAGSSIVWDEVVAGEEAYRKTGAAITPELVASVRRTKSALKGPMGNPGAGYLSPNVDLRAQLGLWCNVRMAIYFEGARSPFPGTFLIVIRDVTEDIGRGVQQMVGEDAGVAIKFITRASSDRVSRFAFEYARAHYYTHLTIPHQAPSLRTTDALFLSTAMAAAKDYPDLTVDDEAMDGLSTHLAMRPQSYEVLLCPNSYGGILCGLCAGLVGGVGLMPGVNLDGEGIAVFEAGHGSAPKYKGLNKMNPVGMILSGAMLLEHVGQPEAAARVKAAVSKVIAEHKYVTYDLGGTATTTEMAEAIVAAL